MSIPFLRRFMPANGERAQNENNALSMTPLGDGAPARSGVIMLANPDHLSRVPATPVPQMYNKRLIVDQPDGTRGLATAKTPTPPTPPRLAFGDRTNQSE